MLPLSVVLSINMVIIIQKDTVINLEDQGCKSNLTVNISLLCYLVLNIDNLASLPTF